MSVSLPPASSVPSAAVLAIGDEVLRGEIVNANAAFLSEELFALGFAPAEHVVVSDDADHITRALRRLAEAHQVVVVTGGLGPTDDDRTVAVVCELLGVKPVTHEPSLAVMRERFEKHGYTLTPNNLKQAEVPGGSVVLPNAAGLAPGFSVRFDRATLFFMPGVPREMRRIFADHVAPAVARLAAAAGVAPALSRVFHVYGMGESHIDHRLQGILAETPGISDGGIEGVTLHYRTAAPENHVRVIVRARDLGAGAALLDRLDAEIRARLGAVVYGLDDESFVLALQRTFRASRKTLALAESCTGGYAGKLITDEPGASEFFRGGVICYANAIKTEVLGVAPEILARDGAVSEACARAMALGARRVVSADVAVAITGVAGSVADEPGLASPVTSVMPGAAAGGGGKPVGTVCFGLADAGGVFAETKFFSGGRERIRRSSAYYALDLARRAALGLLPTSPVASHVTGAG